MFGTSKTIVDENSGQVLHKSHSAAKRKYHQKNSNGDTVSTAWAGHAAEVDHKVSLESLHSRVKSNPFLTDSDLKEIANKDYNYQILSKSQNASKGADSSLDLNTHIKLQTEFGKRTIKNATGEFSAGAYESVKDSAFTIILNEVAQVLSGDKDSVEAVKDGAKAVATTAVVGGTEKLIVDVASHLFRNSGNAVLSGIVEMNAVGQIVVLGTAVGASAIKYLKGEITGEQLTEEIALNGMAVGVSTLVSIACPVPLLAPIISIVAVKVVSMIHELNHTLDDYLLIESKVKKLEAEALSTIRSQQKSFRRIVDECNKEFDNKVSKGLYTMLINADSNLFDVSKIAEGLDEILSLCDEKAAFHSIGEWESQLDTKLDLCF